MSDRLTTQMFGLGLTIVFIGALLLNAISYG